MPKIDEVTVQDYKTLLFFSHPPASTLSVSCALFWLVDGLTNLLDPRTTSKDNFVCLYINFLCAPLPWLGPGEGPVTFAKLQFNPLLGLLSGFLLTSFPTPPPSFSSNFTQRFRNSWLCLLSTFPHVGTFRSMSPPPPPAFSCSQDNIREQAGLSRATLEISSELLSHFPLRPQKSYSTHFKVIFALEIVFYHR